MSPAGTATAVPRTWRGGWREGLRYGGLGLPLAFVALPLYVVLPHHYASHFGVPLAALGAMLLAVRALDALVDPWIGGRVDGWFAGGEGRVGVVVLAAAAILALGFRGLFFPAEAARSSAAGLLVWCALLLVVTTTAFSVLSVLHQAWGARLGGDAAQRARIVSWREALALVGVLVASVLPSLAGLSVATLAFAVLLVLGVALLLHAPRPLAGRPGGRAQDPATRVNPWQVPAFRRLMVVYLLNGTAAAVPATLVLFFIRDRLQAPAWEPLFLAAYFAAGALSMPLWVRAVRRVGLARSWLGGMLLAVLAFVWAALLDSGDSAAFLVVCLASGAALGADLALPGAMLAGVVQRAGHAGSREGAYFGWWNFATKLNLALAAGLALPLLAMAGYTPGARDPEALLALTLAYALLPCALKLAAAGVLAWGWIGTPLAEREPTQAIEAGSP